MALRNIVKEGDQVLRKNCREVTDFNERLHILLDDMKETLIVADGAGLAAPQVGILKRVAIVSVDEEYYEIVNPVIIAAEGEQTGPEGCLSVPGIYGSVSRPMKVTVRAQDRYGKEFTVTGEGLLARAFCHEIDHLDGILFKDKVIEYYEEA
ncbi:MAG: peptide deformylase [Oscillospiraceae bacterium]|nr:peptide deformylase [Oscillospiraceae bacterium]